MRSIHALAFAALFSSALLLGSRTAPANAQEESDTIRMADGKTQSAKIQTEDFKGLVIALEKGQSALPWKSVRSIQYGGAPEFSRAAEAFASGNFELAIEAFSAVAEEPKQRQPIRQQALFHVALGKHRLGDFDGARDGYLAIVSAYPKGRFLLSAVRGLVSIGLASEKPAESEKPIDDAIAAAKAAGLDPGSLAELSIVAARLREESGDAARTKETYATAEKAPGLSPDAVQLAKIGQARCLAAEDKSKEAESILRQVVTTDTAPSVLAAAWNALGSVATEEGRKKRDAQRLYEGLFAYLRGVVQYVPAPNEPTDEHERALAGAVKCFKFIAEIETKADKKKTYAERSRERAEQLKRLYPHSAFIEGS